MNSYYFKRLFFVFLLPLNVLAQRSVVDSLSKLISNSAKDSARVDLLCNLAKFYWKAASYDSAMNISDHAEKLAVELNYKTGLTNSASLKGVIFMTRGKFPEALAYQTKALRLREELLQSAEKSKDEARITKVKTGLSLNYNNIGTIYSNMQEYTEALEYFKKCLDLAEETGNEVNRSMALNNIAGCFVYMGQYDEAFEMHKKNLAYREAVGDPEALMESLNGVGLVLSFKGKYAEAINYYQRALKLCMDIEDKEGAAICHQNIANALKELKRYPEAGTHLEKAVAYLENTNSEATLLNVYSAEIELDSASGDYKNAFEHHKLFIALRDKMLNADNTKKMLETKYGYEMEKKELQNKAEQDRKEIAHAAEKKKQQLLIVFALCGLAVVIGFLAILFQRFRITKKQKLIIEKQKEQVDQAYEELHEKNKEVLDSIYYARRIQRALLTPEKYINRNLRILNQDTPN